MREVENYLLSLMFFFVGEEIFFSKSLCVGVVFVVVFIKLGIRVLIGDVLVKVKGKG